MRSVPLFTILMLTTAPVFAQNYVAPKNYNNPDVVVNLDVIGSGLRPTMARPAIQPRLPDTAPIAILSENLPMLQEPAPQLVAPAIIPPVTQRMMETKPPLADIPPPPVAPAFVAAPLPKPLPRPVPAPAYVAPIASAPAMPAPIQAPKVLAETDNAPMPLVPNTILKDEIDLPLPKPQEALKAPANPARELLAAARAEADEAPVAAAVAVPKPRERVIFDEAPSQITEALPTQKVAAAPAQPVAKAALAPAPVEADAEPEAMLVDDFEAYRLAFGAESSELIASEKAVLDKIVGKMKAEDKTRLQLRAYAGGSPDTSSAARRMSLSRALNVRSYLSEKGVAPSRLDVRAFGMGTAPARPDIPADRVDVIFVR